MTEVSARALALFDEIVELPVDARESRLAALAAADPALYAALRALLQADAGETAGVLDRSPAQMLAEQRRLAEREAPQPRVAAPDLRVGARLGAWRIDRVIGRGGMGTVYQAHRDDGEYQQRVAIKCVRTELDSPRLVAAMREERNLLARLDHPGIAALVDGGVDDAGQPWFALRYVEGEPIDAWCDRRRLGVGARVELLLQVCDAVAYAHTQGVLHRDLKPSNVLVADDGRVQLLDFGISAQIGPLHEAAQHMLSALTPQYAAPETLGHGVQGPATDLYSLGVLGYRLLSGQWPTPLHSLRNLVPSADPGQPMAMAQMAEDASDADAQARAATAPATLARQLRGDLSAIALKAVATRPQDRYASVAEFADDLRRWREGRPVRARPGTWLSRTRKWLRRNPMATGLSAALVLAAVVGGGGAWWQHHQALREADANEQVGRLFASTLGSATLTGLGNARFSSRALLEQTERELQALPLADQPAVHAHALAILARGYIQIGDYRRASQLDDRAQRLSTDANDLDEDGFVAATHLSLLNYQGRHREALELARARLRQLTDNDVPAYAQASISIGIELARSQWALGETERALASADGLLLQAQAAGAAGAARTARVLILRSEFLHGLGLLARSEADAQRALALARAADRTLVDEALERLVDIRRVRSSLNLAASARALLDERRRNLGPNHPETALAEVYVAIGLFPNVSRESAAHTLARIESGYGRDHPVYALAKSRLAWTLASNRDEELLMQREAVAVLRRTRPHSEMLFNTQSNLAKLLMRRQDGSSPAQFAEGIELLRRNILQRKRAGLSALNDQGTFVYLALRNGDTAQFPFARQTLDEALAKAARIYAPHDLEWLNLSLERAIIRYRLGEAAPADAEFAQILQLLDSKPREADNIQFQLVIIRVTALTHRAIYALDGCRNAQALTFIDEAARLSAGWRRSRMEITDRDVRMIQHGLHRGRAPVHAPFSVQVRSEAGVRWRPAACRGDRSAPPAAPPSIAGTAATAVSESVVGRRDR